MPTPASLSRIYGHYPFSIVFFSLFRLLFLFFLILKWFLYITLSRSLHLKLENCTFFGTISDFAFCSVNTCVHNFYTKVYTVSIYPIIYLRFNS